jgi:O-methyltransferase
MAQLSVLRLDGDMYDSTMVALRSLYPKLSVGGYVIVDDYDAVRGCKLAVDDFRREFGITDALQQVDWTCSFWRRST